MESYEIRRKMKVLQGYGRLRRGMLGLTILAGIGLWLYAVYTFVFTIN